MRRVFNTLRPRQNGRLFADDTFKRIFLNENIRISTKNSLKFVPKGLINNILALVLIMAWRRPGDKPLSEPMMVRLPTHICVTRPQWVKTVPILFVIPTFSWRNKGPAESQPTDLIKRTICSSDSIEIYVHVTPMKIIHDNKMLLIDSCKTEFDIFVYWCGWSVGDDLH